MISEEITGLNRGSAIWLGYRKIQELFFDFLRWRINTGSSILIGLEPTVLGLEDSLSPDLISSLHSRGLFSWNKLIHAWSSSTPVWKTADELNLPPTLCHLWVSALKVFDVKGIKQSGTNDVLVWSKSRSTQPVSVKDLYAAASSTLQPLPMPWFPSKFWKSSCPLKAILFSWLVFSNRNLSWEVLQRKGWTGPGRCVMCCQAPETNIHMFFQCPASAKIWYELSLTYGFPHQIFSPVQVAFKWWSEQVPAWRSIFILTCWFLWKWRNARIFQESNTPIDSVLVFIAALAAPD